MKSPFLPKPANFLWNHSSMVILGAILAVISLVIYIWWPLVQEYLRYFDPAIPLWQQVDWLLIGIFLFMSIQIAWGADLRRDGMLVIVGFVGGFLIESWGTHTRLWTYYTGEQPPIWILPAWPIAALAIERMTRRLANINFSIPKVKWIYILIFSAFIIYQLFFTAPTLNRPASIFALAGVIGVTVTSGNQRYDLLTFLCGAALGYFLETWGTTRECWAYYSGQRPPLFAVLAHGFASVAFWRMTMLVRYLLRESTRRLVIKPSTQ